MAHLNQNLKHLLINFNKIIIQLFTYNFILVCIFLVNKLTYRCSLLNKY